MQKRRQEEILKTLTGHKETVLKHFKKEAYLFTHDDDFLKIASEWQAQQEEHYGIIFVHQQKLSIGECISKDKTYHGRLISREYDQSH